MKGEQPQPDTGELLTDLFPFDRINGHYIFGIFIDLLKTAASTWNFVLTKSPG